MHNGPRLLDALALARTLATDAFEEDQEIKLLGVTHDRGTEHSFGIEVSTKHGTRTVYVVAKKDTWAYSSRDHGANPIADRVLVKAGYCLDYGTRYGAKEKTRNVPVRKDGTLSEKTLRRAIVESVGAVKDDLERRAERERQETAAEDAQTAVRDAIERAHPGTFDGYMAWGNVEIPALDKADASASVKVEPGGHITISLDYLSEQDALEILRRLTKN